MKKCPFCAEQIQDDAIKCRHCGEFLNADMARQRGVPMPIGYFGWEYRSQATLLGWPLVHIAHGINARTGAPRVAKGVIAIGNIAIGALAIGGMAFGGCTLGGVSLGVLAVGGVALGGIAFGGLALGILLAVGGAAFSLMYAIGGLAIAPHALGSGVADPEVMRFLREHFPQFAPSFPEHRPAPSRGP